MDVKERVISLLWAGKPGEARKSIETERARLQAALRELDSLMPPEAASAGLFNGTAHDSDAEGGGLTDERQVENRRAAVIDIAKRVAARDGEVIVPVVVEIANKSGVNLGVQKDREIQAVATILRRSSDQFRKTAKNVYEYLGR